MKKAEQTFKEVCNNDSDLKLLKKSEPELYSAILKAIKEHGNKMILEGVEKLQELLKHYEANKDKMTLSDYEMRKDVTFHCQHEIKNIKS